MAQLELKIADINWLDANALQRSIEGAGDVRLVIEVPELYRAATRTYLAQNWLKVWYVCECLAQYTTQVACDFHEVDFGAGVVVLDCSIKDVPGFLEKLLELGPAFDPDELEAPALIYDEAEDWLDKRGDIPALLPQLEECYRDDAEIASVEEGYRSSNCDLDDQLD
jgi:hypothetical protein